MATAGVRPRTTVDAALNKGVECISESERVQRDTDLNLRFEVTDGTNRRNRIASPASTIEPRTASAAGG